MVLLMLVAAVLVHFIAGPARLSSSAEMTPRALGRADGVVPAGAPLSPLADAPAMSRLDPLLRGALREATRDAAKEGIPIRAIGGWRSPRYQRALLRRAGPPGESRRKALRSVGASPRVRGEFADIGSAGALWLMRHGNRYGLCNMYLNEIWHLEVHIPAGGSCAPEWPDGGAE